MMRELSILLAVILSLMCFSACAETYTGVELVDFIYAEGDELVENPTEYEGKYVRTSFVFDETEDNYCGLCGEGRRIGLLPEDGVSLDGIERGSVIAVIAQVETIPDSAEEILRLTVCRVLSPVDSEGVPGGRVDYICNTNTGKFHLPDCSSVGDMKEKNKGFYSGVRDALVQAGYDPCKRCNP